MIPNFIVIGAAKCGTTSICDILGSHPGVYMCQPKEPCYFSHLDDEKRTLSWYEGLFEQVRDETAVGEGSTAYTHPEVIDVTARRIHEAIPNCRLIYMVRHPLRRLESDWRMRRHEGWAPADISDAALEQASLVGHGLYWRNLSVYRQYFSDEQILVVFLEDFKRDPDSEVARCLAHIGVNGTVDIADASRPRNSSADFRKDGTLASVLRRMDAFDRLKARAPTWLISSLKRLLTRNESFEVEWRPEVRDRISALLAEDAALFLPHCRKSPDFWKL